MSNLVLQLFVSFATLQIALCGCPLPTFVRNGTVTADWDVGSYPVARFLNPPQKDYVLSLTAPVGKKVQVRITAIQAIQTEPELGCDATCSTQGIIIRTGDPNMPEKRICCNSDKHLVYTSTTNKMTLITYNCEKVKTVNTLFAFEFRYVDQAWTPPAKLLPPAPRSKCGVMLTATKEWNKATYVMNKNGETENEANPRNCSVMIKAPAGKKVRVRIVEHDLLCGCGGPECAKKGLKIQLRNPAVKDPYEMCVQMKKDENFCNNPNFEFRDIKMSCARTCELCGKKAEDCADLQDKAGCLEMKKLGKCDTDALFAEYMCADTCGYCTNPL